MARLIFRWILGMAMGTALIAVTSPFFVRSYLSRQVNRNVLTLPAGQAYRWRSEGYATTHIGPGGLPGTGSFPLIQEDTGDSANGFTIALWGDSQGEGACVDDTDKLFAIAWQQSAMRVLPFARSGDDASDWLAQMPASETELGVDMHVLLVAEMIDLAAASSVPAAEHRSRFDFAADQVPDFAVHAARNLLFEADSTRLRSLRFTVGPVDQQQPQTPPGPVVGADSVALPPWDRAIAAIRQATDKPVVILYAPALPAVVGNRVIFEDADAGAFDQMKVAAARSGIPVIDVRDELAESARSGKWPHGFHNGRFGSGHLNVVGNNIVAGRLVEACRRAAAEVVATDEAE